MRRLSASIESGEHPKAPGSCRSAGTRSTNAPIGRLTSCGCIATHSHRTPSSSMIERNSDNRRLLPMPGSPETTTSLASP